MRPWWVMVVGILGLSSCGGISYKMAVPIYPAEPKQSVLFTGPYRPPIVDSLIPTFRWQLTESLGPDVRYDILVYEAYQGNNLEWAIGRKVYYREGLNTSNHTPEIQLEPNRAYYWAVRVRRDQKPATEWSSFIYFHDCSFIGTGCETEDFPFFLLMTPAK